MPLVALLLACGNPFVARLTRVVIEPEVTDFWAVPLPSELRSKKTAPTTFSAGPARDPSW